MIIAGAGHRPDKLPNKETGYILPNPTYIKICKEIEKHLLDLKPEKVISGMAIGYDQYLANVAIKLNIPLVAALPFKGQESKWNNDAKKIYNKLLSKASEIVIVSDGEYTVSKMQIRNEYLVDNCDILLCCWNGQKFSGTYNCIEYARNVGRKMILIDYKKLDN